MISDGKMTTDCSHSKDDKYIVILLQAALNRGINVITSINFLCAVYDKQQEQMCSQSCKSTGSKYFKLGR